MTHPKHYAVRIVKSPSRSPLAQKHHAESVRHELIKKVINIFTGSSIGFMTGLVIYLMLRSAGINIGGLESSVIIGLPAVLGLLTSYAIF